jgi:hypothetical protein
MQLPVQSKATESTGANRRETGEMSPMVKSWTTSRQEGFIARAQCILDDRLLVQGQRAGQAELSTGGAADSQLSSTVNSSVSDTITDRSITFCSSRTFPGHG